MYKKYLLKKDIRLHFNVEFVFICIAICYLGLSDLLSMQTASDQGTDPKPQLLCTFVYVNVAEASYKLNMQTAKQKSQKYKTVKCSYTIGKK